MSGGATGDDVPSAWIEQMLAARARGEPPQPSHSGFSRRDLFDVLFGEDFARLDELFGALAGDPALAADFRLLCRRLAALHMPPVAAASTGPLAERAFGGSLIRQTPLPDDPGQVMVTIIPRRGTPTLSRLLLDRSGQIGLQRQLPHAAANGRIQFIADQAVADDAKLLTLLNDAAADGYFFS